ncbi:MAG TPA: DUF3048 domain-containing protein [Candidatus Limnocylindrales bacterium]|nr:DUF3048 domain-containing protein [Candidatus Limnocylindrales bacterium]
MDLLRSRTTMLVAAAVLLIAIAGGGWLAFGGPPTPQPSLQPTGTPSPSPTPIPTPSPSPIPTPSPDANARCPLNGLALANPDRLDLPALAVQIENHPLARPVTNLARADMVVEATVEGDVTRYTGIYLCRKSEGLVGPVRSGRYYSIDLWQDLHVLPFFFGAETEGIARYMRARMPFVNGIHGGWPYFYRSRERLAPHNLYADLQLVGNDFGRNTRLDRLAKRVGELRPSLRFSEGAKLPTGRRVHRVQLWTNSYWNFGWEWDGNLQEWRRNEAGLEHVDAGTHRVLTATSVLVQYVREDIVYAGSDPGGYPRRYHHLVGHGRATLYVGGRAIAVRWSRRTKNDRTHWTYVDGGERVVLPPGVVWWEILPVYTTVKEQ